MDTTHPLLEFHWIPWHVYVDQASRHLQIDALSAGTGADQELGAACPPESLDLTVPVQLALGTDDQGGHRPGAPIQESGKGGHRLDGLGK